MIKRILFYTLLITIGFISFAPHKKQVVSPDLNIAFGLKFNNRGFYPIVRLVDPILKYSCTAFIIDTNYAITAAHCLNSQGSLPTHDLQVFLNQTNQYVPVRAMGYDEDLDTGLVMGDFHLFRSLNTDFKNEMDDSSDFLACGYPRNQKRMICNKFTPETRSFDIVKGRGQFYHGMSGGPVINTYTNKVIGIVDAMDGEGYAYVVPLQAFFGIFPQIE